MKKTLIALTATVAMSLGSIALADEAQGPMMMTDAQLDTIVAGKDMYVWTDTDTEATDEYIVSGNKHLAPGTTKKPGNKNGWVEYQTTCDSEDGTCDNEGTISYDVVEVIEVVDGDDILISEWVYTPPAI